jgi:hypothetical protein
MRLFFTTFCFTLGLVQSSTAVHPNVVFFLVDDMGWRDVACFGSSFYETPNIDRFAKQGFALRTPTRPATSVRPREQAS